MNDQATPKTAAQIAEAETAQTPAKRKASSVGEKVAASGAAVSAGGIAVGLTTVCASGGCGIAAAGGMIGGTAAAGPFVMAGAPAYVSAKVLNNKVFNDKPGQDEIETEARKAARKATNVGALVGVGGAGVITVSNGFKASAALAKLASIGATVGGGALAGALMLAVLPVATATAAGAGAYYWKKSRKPAGKPRARPAPGRAGTLAG